MSDDKQLSSDEDKDPTKPSEVDHGERPDHLKEQDKIAEETMKDPGGDTPAQMRPDNDAHDDAFGDEDARPVSGFSPEAVNDTVEDPQEGGTLPPA